MGLAWGVLREHLYVKWLRHAVINYFQEKCLSASSAQLKGLKAVGGEWHQRWFEIVSEGRDRRGSFAFFSSAFSELAHTRFKWSNKKIQFLYLSSSGTLWVFVVRVPVRLSSEDKLTRWAMGKSQFLQIKPQRCKRDPAGAFIGENKQKWHQALLLYEPI